jgi:hypothetical protein
MTPADPCPSDPTSSEADTPIVIQEHGVILGTKPMASFINQIPGGVKETDAMTRSLLSVTSTLDGHHQKNRLVRIYRRK